METRQGKAEIGARLGAKLEANLEAQPEPGQKKEVDAKAWPEKASDLFDMVHLGYRVGG